jgi:hypothetical protein
MLKSSRRWQVLCALGGRVACAGAYSSPVFIQDDVSAVLQSFTSCLVLLLYVSTSVQKGATRRSPRHAYALGGGVSSRLRGRERIDAAGRTVSYAGARRGRIGLRV